MRRQFEWIIEYWKSANTFRFSSLDDDWKKAPKIGVIYVWFFVEMNNKQYITKLKGKDYYFFDGKRFGGFNNRIRSETSYDGRGSYFKMVNERLSKIITPDHTRPRFVKDEDIKEGVWVPEPYANELGLSKGSQVKRSKPELRKYKR